MLLFPGVRSPGVQLSATYEGLLIGNWYLSEKENPNYDGWFNSKTYTGWLAESWEMTDPQTFVFHIRKGVHFQNKPPVNGRELTAEDVKWSFEQTLAAPPAGKGTLVNIDKITTPDKYTVVFHTITPRTDDFLSAFVASHSSGGFVYPHEVIDTYGKSGFADWRHAIGTGPWIAEDYLEGSSATFVRNPDYWDYDKDYPENRLPYADGLVILFITDPATTLAAVRTGKIDRHWEVSWDQVDSLLKTSPWLKYRTLPPPGFSPIGINTKNKPLSDVRVRQAMLMAVDNEAIIRDIYGGNGVMGIDNWPYLQSWGDYFIQPDEYPQIVRDMFSHDLDQAKRLMAEAGYPNGFTTEFIASDDRPGQMDMAVLIKSYLADIGVKAEIKVMPTSAKFASVQTLQRTFPGMLLFTHTGGSVANSPDATIETYYLLNSIRNYSSYDNAHVMDLYNQAITAPDEKERIKLLKEAGIQAMVDAPYIIIPSYTSFSFWAPWLKGGYWGQYGMTRQDYNMHKHWWLDQDLKKSITGK